MRKIKCRGLVIEPLVSEEKWITSDEEYHEVYLNHAECSAYINGHAVVWESVSEYTGSKDSNDVEIFEGDILQSIKDETYMSVVEYCTESIGSCGCCYDEFEGAGFKAKDLRFKESVVVGNIYENPELLGDSK